MMDIAARSLKIKRTVVSRLLDEGLYPYTKRYLGNFDNHFSTIGLVGMNEAGLNAAWIGKDLTYPASLPDCTDRHTLPDRSQDVLSYASALLL